MVLHAGAAIAAGGAGLIGLGGVVLGPILGMFHEAVSGMNAARKAADQLGATTEEVSALGYAAKSVGMDLDGMTDSFRHFDKIISDAASGDQTAIDTLNKLGTSAAELVGQPLEKKADAIADGLKRMGQEDAAATVMDALGKTGRDLLPVLQKGAAGLAEWREKAKNVGAIITTEDAKKAKTFTSAVGQAKDAISGLSDAIGASLLEVADTVKEFSDAFVAVVKEVREFVEENRGLVLAVAAVAAGLIAAGAVFVAVGTGLAALSVAAGGFMAALSAVGGVLAVVFSPVGLGIAALAVAGVMVAALVAEFADLESIGNTLGSVWRGVSESFLSTWRHPGRAIGRRPEARL
jgi:phage-related tail protein